MSCSQLIWGRGLVKEAGLCGGLGTGNVQGGAGHCLNVRLLLPDGGLLGTVQLIRDELLNSVNDGRMGASF